MPQKPSDFEGLLEYLKRTRAFDFSGYKRGSLERRIGKRMQTVGCTAFGDYVDYLEVHPEEFSALFNTVLINVTSFFRDAAAWDFLRESVIPDLVARRAPGAPIRIWSAGCASGEEAYTLAMVFAEVMGLDLFKDAVKIYATDIDDEALAKARQAVYTAREVEGIPPEMVEKYFESLDDRYVFRKDLRRHVIFGRHDVIQDSPISRVDMLVCRNTLMYFNGETQAKILSRFQFALNERGILFLGRAETLMTHSSAFAPIELKQRISTKLPVPGAVKDRRSLALAQLAVPVDANGNGGPVTRLREAALDAVWTAHLLVDAAGTLVMANERARALFGLMPADVGRPLQDLKISYRPLELRSLIEQAYLDRRPVIAREIEWPASGNELRWLDVHVIPLYDPASATMLGASVSFHDISLAKRLHRDLEHANQELETAYEELQSTNEELETTNEELQSTVEELETTNEELQSTNEELETMNEELQSMNEELQAMNDELRRRGDEVGSVNAFLESILASMRGAVMVVDADLNVLIWNDAAEELWGLRPDEARGKHILGLDIGLPLEKLRQPMRACLAGTKNHVSLTLDAINRRGRALQCQITITPLRTRLGTIHGLIILAEDCATNGDGKRPAKKKLATTTR